MNLFSTPRKISLVLGLSRFLKMFLGLVVLYLSVKYFGTSYERDSWVLSIALYGIIICFLYSPINETFRTKYIFLREKEGEGFAMKSVNSLMNFFNLTYVVIALLLFSTSEFVTQVLAPGFDLSKRGYLATMIFTLIPYFIFLQQSNVLIALLNTYESYFYPELVSLLSSVINIISIIFLSPYIGIYSLVVATTLNGLILVSVLSCMLRRKVPSFRLVSSESLSLSKSFVIFSLPMYLSAFCVQLYFFVEKSTCTNYGEGAVSVFDYARQITNLPHVVFSSIVPIVMTPLLSKCFINGDLDGFSDEMRKFMRLMLYFTLFVVLLFLVDGQQISYLLFSDENEDFIHILAYLGAAVFCLVFSMICGQSLIAQNCVTDYVIAVITGNVISVVLCLTLSGYVKLDMLALFYLLGQFIVAVFLSFKVKIRKKVMLMKDLAAVSLTGLISFAGLCLLQYSLSSTLLLSNDKMYAALDLFICAVLLFFIILCCLITFGGEERQLLLSYISRIKKGKDV